MEAALALADRLDDTAIPAVQNGLLSGQRGWEQHAGRYRDGLVWVGTSSISPRGASHVAPQPELVAPEMSDLVDFMHRDDLPVLVQDAVVDDLAAQISQAKEQLGSLRPQAAAWKVVPHLVAHPVVNAAFLTGRLGMNAVTAQRALVQLSDAGVLHERTGKQRNRIWQHDGILAVLDVFAQGIRRR
ncbi:hypothetical protein H9623_15185 [Oerskovia sp. Sa1BUA8]|uniref:Fic family protein n=1 Tax=Oerskovia douganii TaxID=2762210 RepID=A0A9D5YZY5_9CELL|nr:hypothetical protein [Oerskovia douganii]MBE7701635.1 hypothetical protein [Oerskovia douganii]